MARPNKSGLDYFPLDVSLDEKIELVEARHGLLGFGLIIKLFQNIYKTGYYADAAEDHLLLLKKRLGIEYDFIVDVINSACMWRLFNEKLFQKYSVLTSCGIQKRFIEATKRRKEVDFIKEYLLIKNVKSYYTDTVNVNINELNVNINPENDNDNPQSKEKKRIKRLFVENSNEFRLAKYLFEHIRKNNPEAKTPNFQTWSKHFDYIIRIDGRTVENIKKVIEWCQTDSFWLANILSPGTLRKQYDSLWLKMGHQEKPGPARPTPKEITLEDVKNGTY